MFNQLTSIRRNIYVEDSNPDIIYSYSSVLIALGLIFVELFDIVKLPNRNHQKTDNLPEIPYAFLKGHHSK